MKILFLDLDTLRPDHLGCYGYPRNTSPNIDAIAARGVRFENYYVPDAPCLPARASLISGMLGIHNGAVNHGGTCADLRHQGPTRSFRSQIAEDSLWNLFRDAKMYTCSISSFAERHSAFWFLAGLNEMHNPTGKGGTESAEEVTPTVLKWLDDHADREDWMLHVNYWDPHTPYRAPAEFGNPFAEEPIPSWLTDEVHEFHKTLAGPHTCRDNGMYHGHPNPHYPRQPNDIASPQQLRECIDGYDCGIRYMDDHIGQIVAKLDEQGILDETAIIITADHGENFGELGLYSEHATADHATCRIPMILHWPGLAQQGHVDQGLHYSLDLLPTLCDLLGVRDKKPAHWDGVSFAASVTQGKNTSRDELILSQCAHVCQRSVRWDDWLYIRTYHDGLHPHFEDEMLFDLAKDPHETHNLAQENPTITQQGASRLDAWKDEQLANPPFGPCEDPLEVVLREGGPEHAHHVNETWLPTYKTYLQRLRDTNRGQWINPILQRHPALTAAL